MSWFTKSNEREFHREVCRNWEDAGYGQEADEEGREPTEEELAHIRTHTEQAVERYQEQEAAKPALVRWLGL